MCLVLCQLAVMCDNNVTSMIMIATQFKVFDFRGQEAGGGGGSVG